MGQPTRTNEESRACSACAILTALAERMRLPPFAMRTFPHRGVWLPIALTCRICHNTQYRDTYRTPKYHYILAITPTPQTTTLDSSSQCSINTDTINAAYIHLCQGMQYRDGYRTPHYHHILAMTFLSLDSPCWDHHYPYRRPRYRIYAPIPRHWTHSLTTPGPRTRY
jgi:hypothetical protein